MTLPQYLQLKTLLTLNEDEQHKIAALPNPGSLVRELRTRLALSKVGYEGLALPLKQIAVTRTIPIMGTITEYVLVQTMNELELALSLVADTLSGPLEAAPAEITAATVTQVSPRAL